MTAHLKLHVSITRWQSLASRFCYRFRRPQTKPRAKPLQNVAAAMFAGLWASCLAPHTILAADSKLGSAPPAAADNAAKKTCLPDGSGFLRARLTGSIQAELDWRNGDTECAGDERPDSGARLRFSHDFGTAGQRLVLVFGIPELRAGKNARGLPVNVTVIREGAGEFYGTRGEDKCTIDQLTQQLLVDSLHNRSYRIVASGFCTQPARAVVGDGSIFISRFDFVGRVNFSAEDSSKDVVAEALTGK